MCRVSSCSDSCCHIFYGELITVLPLLLFRNVFFLLYLNFTLTAQELHLDTSWFQLCCVWGESRSEPGCKSLIITGASWQRRVYRKDTTGNDSFNTLWFHTMTCWGVDFDLCSVTYKLTYSSRASSFLPGSEGMILSLASIWPDSMGNMSFKDFCDENKIFLSSDDWTLFCPNVTEQSLYFMVQMDLRGKCGFQDTSCRWASLRGRSISPSACTPAHI